MKSLIIQEAPEEINVFPVRIPVMADPLPEITCLGVCPVKLLDVEPCSELPDFTFQLRYTLLQDLAIINRATCDIARGRLSVSSPLCSFSANIATIEPFSMAWYPMDLMVTIRTCAPCW